VILQTSPISKKAEKSQDVVSKTRLVAYIEILPAFKKEMKEALSMIKSKLLCYQG
jgi:hypothetical protein